MRCDCLAGLYLLAILLDATLRAVSEEIVIRTDLWQEIIGEDIVQCRKGDVIIGAALNVGRRNEGTGECSNEVSTLGVQSVETINMVIDQVNRNESLLPGIKLGTVITDTCMSDVHALKGVISEVFPFFLDIEGGPCSDMLMNDSATPLFAGVIGAVLSEVSIVLAKLLQAFSVPQISPWSTSSELSDKTRYENFFRTVPPDSYQVKAMLRFVERMEWNYISVVYDDSAYGNSGFAEILLSTENSTVCIAYSHAIPSNSKLEEYAHIANALLAHDRAKAVILFTTRSSAAKVISATWSLSHNHSKIWIASDGWATLSQPEDYACDECLDGAVGFTFNVEHVSGLDDYMTNLTLVNRPSNNTSLNPWFGRYLSIMNNCSLLGEHGLRKCEDQEHLDEETFLSSNTTQNVGNAVLTFVYALDRLHQRLCGGEDGVCYAMSEMRGKNDLAKELFYEIKNITFRGINGRTFSFDANQDAPHVYDIFIFQKSDNATYRWEYAGTYQNEDIDWKGNIYYKVNDTKSTCSDPCEPGESRIAGNDVCCWKCVKCPDDEYVSANGSCAGCIRGERVNPARDGCEDLPVRQMEDEVFYTALSLVLGSLGIIFTIIVSVIYIIYRHTPMVKASGKELSFFVLVGVFLTFSNCFPLIATPTTLSCTAFRTLLCIGPTWMYAGLLTKTIRIVIIFRSKLGISDKMKFLLRPVPQLCVASGLVLLQLLTCSGWFMSAPPNPAVLNPTDDVAFFACANLVEIGILSGIVYPFLLILICVILATANRNVPTAFNEAMFIGFTMYATCVIWLAFVSIYFTNSTNIGQKLMTVSVSLSLSAVTVLCCLFLPRCYTVLFRPEKNTTLSVMSRSTRVVYFENRAVTAAPRADFASRERPDKKATNGVALATVSAKVRFQG